MRTVLFGSGWPKAPHRALRTPFVAEWLADDARGSAERADEMVEGARDIILRRPGGVVA